jgi:hypothetical protein
MKTAIDVSEPALLCELSDDELDHVSVGLELNFGAQLAGNHGEPETFGLLLESGRLIGIDARTITVIDVWNVAKAASL